MIAGHYQDAKALPPPNSWASEPKSDVAIWIIQLDPGASWTLPATHEKTARNLYLVDGHELSIAEQTFADRIRVSVHPAAKIEIQNGNRPSRLLLMQGKPIGEPVVQHGPFVMNTREEIIQAFNDYQRTQFGGWP